jgi:glycosyltransferase involved in cell wall biosynthesis
MSMHIGVSGWLLGHSSGANRRLLALVEHAARLMEPDERITVLHGPTFDPPSIPGQVAWHAIDIPVRSTLRRALRERLQLASIVRDLDIDVLDHGMLPLPRVPCPVVWTVHDVRDAEGMGRHPSWLARMTLQRACRRSATVIVPSHFTAERLQRIAPATHCEVIPNGVELPPAEQLQLGAASYVLHVGHLEDRKNLQLLVRALASLPAAERPLLTLVGADQGTGAALRELADRLEVDDRVHLPGTVAEDELQELYATARAVLVPSNYEGFGLCALEGLAHGRPVYVSNLGALPEVVGDAAHVLPADDVQAWGRAMIRNAADDSLEARRGRRAQAERYTWEHAAAQVLDCWRHAARR